MDNSAEIIAEVFADLRPDFGLVYLKSIDGTRCVFNAETPGVDLTQVKEGQIYLCTLNKGKVLKAKLI